MNLSHHLPVRHGTARSRREGGYALVLSALLLVPMLLMVGLAVDVGGWYNRASDMQKAADAAALAGAPWLPDLAAATDVAKETAKRNGFDDADPDITVTVSRSPRSPRRLRVAIDDARVGSHFFESLGGSEIKLRRTAIAEYITPVPMGSPFNYFGTGKLLSSNPELLYLAENSYCADKVQGDRFQSRGMGATCGAPANVEYRDTGYELYIDVPDGRSSPIEIRLLDPMFSPDWSTGSIPECPPPSTTTTTTTIPVPTSSTSTTTTEATIPTTTESTVPPTTSSPTTVPPTTAPPTTEPPETTTTFPTLLVRPRGMTAAPAVASPKVAGASVGAAVAARPILRASAPANAAAAAVPAAAAAPGQVPCVPYETWEPAFDIPLANTADEPYTYTLFSADGTPLDDADNPIKCQRTYVTTDAFSPYTFLGSHRWNTMTMGVDGTPSCLINPSDRSGKYILRVTNSGAGASGARHANLYAAVARYTDAPDDGLCDSRVDPLCPRVYGKDAISVYANTQAATAAFYLAEIDREHTGKRLKIELWDPGEGGQTIRILAPTGSDTWDPVSFTWRDEVTAPVTDTQLDVTANRFNGRLVTIMVDLAGYDPPADNQWWKVEYQFVDGSAVTDRSTWSAGVIGDPLHLVEEF